MSFILDALRKSENDRQQQGGAEFATVPTSHEGPRAPRWIWVLVALLAVNVTVLVGLLMRNDTPPINDAIAVPAREELATAAGSSFAEQVEAARRQQPADTHGETAAGPAAATVRQPDVIVGSRPEPAPAIAPQYAPATLPTFDELRAAGTLQLPELHLDIHVYSDAPSERFVFINMVRHGERSRLGEGPVVSEITPDGVILDYNGTRFLLPRE